jgi:hypothetical protein
MPGAIGPYARELRPAEPSDPVRLTRQLRHLQPGSTGATGNTPLDVVAHCSMRCMMTDLIGRLTDALSEDPRAVGAYVK